MSQLSFPFQNIIDRSNLYKEEDFLVLNENSSALSSLQKFFLQKEFTSSQFPFLILKGDKACGKTHLLNFLAKKFDARFLIGDEIHKINPIQFFVKNKFYLLEDLDKIKDEELILHLINSAFEAKAFLALSIRKNPHFHLRDLNSRLKNIVITEIKNPSCESIVQLLANGFSCRQIKISKRSLDFISNHIERSYDAVLQAIDKVEFLCREGRKNLSIKELSKIFN